MTTPAPLSSQPHAVPDGGPRFTLVVVGPTVEGIALLVGGAIAGVLPGGWLDRSVQVVVGYQGASERPTPEPGTAHTATVGAVLADNNLPIPPQAPLTPALAKSADLIVTTDAAVYAAIQGWPTAAFAGEPEPPEVFAAYETRVLGNDDLLSRVREEQTRAR